MIYDFAKAWEKLAEGEEIRVSDGSIEPSIDDQMLRNAWGSHNHSGILAEKIDGPVRAFAVEVAIGDNLVRYTVSEAVPHRFERVTPLLEEVDAHLQARIDQEAGAFRLQFITDVPGQQATYQLKESEALEYGVNGKVDPAAFPLLAAEAAETGKPLDQLAAEILTRASQWRWINARIEGRRIGAKDRIRKASTIEDKRAAAAVDWAALIDGPDLPPAPDPQPPPVPPPPDPPPVEASSAPIVEPAASPAPSTKTASGKSSK
jgi:hypothetical protein